MYCRKCGKQINDQNKFCNYCGTPVVTAGGIGNSGNGRMAADDHLNPTSTQKSKKSVIVGFCIGIIALIVVTLIFFVGKAFLQQNETALKDEEEVARHYENETISDEEPMEDTEKHEDTAKQTEEELPEETASTEEIQTSDLSLQEYSDITEDMRNMQRSYSDKEEMLVEMTQIAVAASYGEDGRGRIQKKYSDLTSDYEREMNYKLMEQEVYSHFYGVEWKQDDQGRGFLFDKVQTENLFREFYGKSSAVQWNEDYYYEDYDGKYVLLCMGDGAPWYQFKSYELKENGNYYLMSVPVTYEDNSETEYFVGYGDFLFAKADNVFGATLVYSEFGNWNGKSLAKSATASSQLPDYHEKNYRANNLCDGNLNTVWVEGVDGVGRNEYIVLDLGEIKKVSGLEIYNGYLENKYLFEINGYATRVRVEAPGQDTVEASLMTYPLDGEKEPLDEYEIDMERSLVEFDQPVYTDRLIVTILDAESGSKYEDTCISEMVVY